MEAVMIFLGPLPGYGTEMINLSSSPAAANPVMSPRAEMSESWKKIKELRKSPLATGSISKKPNSKLRLQAHGAQEGNSGSALLMSDLSTGLAPQRPEVTEDKSDPAPTPPPPRSDQGGIQVEEASPQKSGTSKKHLRTVTEERPIVRPRPPQVQLPELHLVMNLWTATSQALGDIMLTCHDRLLTFIHYFLQYGDYDLRTSHRLQLSAKTSTDMP